MTKKLHFLGTGCMMPTQERNHLSVCLELNGELLLFDCGEHTQLQIKKKKLPLSHLKKIFLSHWHGDHVLGLPGLLMSLGNTQNVTTIEIHGPKGTLNYITHMKQSMIFDSKLDLQVYEHTPQKNTLQVISNTSKYTISCAQLNHSVPCIGFQIKEPDTLNINPVKAKEYGLTNSPLLARAKMGLDIEYKNTLIKAEEITYSKKGLQVSFIFDTRPCEEAQLLAQNSNYLVMEATFSYKEHAHKAEEYDHMSAKETAQLAKLSGVKELYITHFSQRYRELDLLIDEAKEEFENTHITYDLMSVVLK
ncbi:MAG: ribonuclease Z [Candidatus Nanoarchaeia archaeon]